MSSRIEIELTSQRNETEWTWRAAGAKQPKGVLDGSVLYPGAKVGDVARAEADFEIDGITIVSVVAPQAKRADTKARIEVKGSSREFQPVTSQLASRPKGEGRGGDRRGKGNSRRDRDQREHKGGERSDRGAGSRPERGPRRERTERPERAPRPQTPQYKRLSPKDDHRKVVLDQLSPEQRPVAEQILRGGMPAVRQAIEAENAKAKAEGRPEINSAALLTMAEGLLPQLKTAEWMDRAEAAKAQLSEVGPRDLRAIVTSADAVARTDEARLLASELRAALDHRVASDREKWQKEIVTCLDENRVIRALRLSARPPDAQTKFPAELLERLKGAAEQSMAPQTAPDRWLMLLDAVASSPVRRSVEPVGLPETPGDELLAAAKAASARIPALAKQLGVTMPPPPPPRRPAPPKSMSPSSPPVEGSPPVNASGTPDATSASDAAPNEAPDAQASAGSQSAGDSQSETEVESAEPASDSNDAT